MWFRHRYFFVSLQFNCSRHSGYALSFVLQQLVAPPANSNSPVLADDDGALEELAGEDGADGNVEDLVAAHGCCSCCGCGCCCFDAFFEVVRWARIAQL